MRKIQTVLALSILCTSSYAMDTWVEVGKAVESEGRGTSIALGFKDRTNWGAKIGMVNNSEFSNYQDYPVPHSNYRYLGEKRTGNTIGFDLDYYLNGESGFRPYLGVGLYAGQKKKIAQSNATGWYYNQGDATSLTVSAEAGIQYKTDSGFIWGLGAHSVRGTFLTVGKQF